MLTRASLNLAESVAESAGRILGEAIGPEADIFILLDPIPALSEASAVFAGPSMDSPASRSMKLVRRARSLKARAELSRRKAAVSEDISMSSILGAGLPMAAEKSARPLETPSFTEFSWPGITSFSAVRLTA